MSTSNGGKTYLHKEAEGLPKLFVGFDLASKDELLQEQATQLTTTYEKILDVIGATQAKYGFSEGGLLAPYKYVEAQQIIAQQTILEKICKEQIFSKEQIYKLFYASTSEASTALEDEQIVRLLEATADFLEAGHWTQGKFSSHFVGADNEGNRYDTYAYCGEGALRLTYSKLILNYSTKTHSSNHPVPRNVTELLMRYLGMPVASWNDMPGRTKDDVVDFFRRAAKWIANGEHKEEDDKDSNAEGNDI